MKELTAQFEKMSATHAAETMTTYAAAEKMIMDQCTPTKIIIQHKDGRIDFRCRVFMDWEGDIICRQIKKHF